MTEAGAGRDAAGTRRAEVWGHPIGHSLSPQLHRAAYRALGLTGWRYDRRDVTSEQLPAAFASLDASYAGLSLTMPLKTAIVPLLDSLDPLAAELGVVNTVVFGDDGARGCNTDVAGIVAALGPALAASGRAGRARVDNAHLDVARSDAGPHAVRPVTALILGSGATAASALVALGELGVGSCVVMTRSPDSIGDLGSLAERRGIILNARSWIEPPTGPADVAISTLPTAAATEIVNGPGTSLPVPAVALDVAYPDGPMGRMWATRGTTVVPGIEMLLHQAARQVELMTGCEAPITAMRAALDSA